MKKYRVLAATLLISLFININLSYAVESTGNIDFFKVFSKNDENIDKVGNRIYNWSIYLPGDAVINKNPQASMFDMYTNSFKTSVSITVLKNIHNLSLQEIYTKLAGSDVPSDSPYDNSYRCFSGIRKDKDNNDYIAMSSISPDSELYKASDDEEEAGTYDEYRVYLGKNNGVNYIYTVNISMDLQYYQQHSNIFLKIADSFRTTFDASNPNIKDLSDQATSYRFFENKIYGWKIELAPYWKLQGSASSTSQIFKPLYSDQEIGSKSEVFPDESNKNRQVALKREEKVKLNQAASTDSEQDISSETDSKKDETDSSKIRDSLSITVVSSVPSNQSFEQWTDAYFKNVDANSNKSLYTKMDGPNDVYIPDAKSKLLVAKVKNTSRDNVIQGTLLVQGTKYRYEIILKITEPKFNEKSGSETFYRMLKSFMVFKTSNRYAGDLTAPEAIFNYTAPRTIAMNKYNLKINTTNNWLESFSIYDSQFEASDYYSDYSSGDDYATSDMDSSESLNVSNAMSGAVLDITADILTEPFEQVFEGVLAEKLKDDEVDSPVLNTSIFKSQVGDITVFKIVENYSITKMEELSSKDSRKVFNYTNLNNSLDYVIKAGDELYHLSFSLPLTSYSAGNVKSLDDMWKNTSINGIKIGDKAAKWNPVNLSQITGKVQ